MAFTAPKFNSDIRIAGNFFSEESRYQQAVLDIQTDATLDPGATPTKGDRYIISNSAALHANFGTITGIGDDDIVEYDGSAFIIAWDASAQGKGACTYDIDSSAEYCYDGTDWSTADHPSGGDGLTFNGGANRFDLDLANTNPGMELTASDGTGELRLSAQGNGIAGGAGSLLSVDPATEVAGSRAAVYVGADGVGVDLDNVTIEHSTSTLQVKDGGISTAKLAADAVDSTKLADNAVGNEHLQDNAVSAAELAANAVTTAKILDANVTSAKIAADAIDSTKIADNAIGNEHLQDDAVNSAELATNAVGDDAFNYADTKLRSGALTDPFTAGLTRTFTHNWATTDVQVELIDSVTGETCYAYIARTANAVAVTLNQTPTNSLRILIREVKADQTTLTVS